MIWKADTASKIVILAFMVFTDLYYSFLIKSIKAKLANLTGRRLTETMKYDHFKRDILLSPFAVISCCWNSYRSDTRK